MNQESERVWVNEKKRKAEEKKMRERERRRKEAERKRKARERFEPSFGRGTPDGGGLMCNWCLKEPRVSGLYFCSPMHEQEAINSGRKDVLLPVPPYICADPSAKGGSEYVEDVWYDDEEEEEVGCGSWVFAFFLFVVFCFVLLVLAYGLTKNSH